MKLIDTHTHLYLPEFDADRDEMIQRAVSSGVVRLLMPNIDIHSVNLMLDAADRFKNVCSPMIGLHPTSVKDDYLIRIGELEMIAAKHKFIAIGEIGIDLYWDKTHLTEQLEALRRQVAFAIQSALPVVIHSREAFREVFSVLDEFTGSGLKGVFHAFSGSIKDAKRAVAIGFKLGIGGPLTFKNSGLDEVTKEVGIKHIILETDSPYLAPVPYRGKRNESSYICIINRRLAEIFGIKEEEAASVTSENACRLFNI
jgi:TatD DNase family protein